MPAHDPDRPEKETALPRTTEALGADIKNSPEVLHADRVRERDERSGAGAGAPADGDPSAAAESLRESRERLESTGARIHETHREVLENRERVDAVEEDARRLGRGTDALERMQRELGPD